jgi:excisionase family DNA binding protein
MFVQKPKSPAVAVAVPLSAEPLWTREEAAAYLRVQPATIYQLTRRRRRIPLPYLPCGKFMRFRKSEIDRWLEQSRQERSAA